MKKVLIALSALTAFSASAGAADLSSAPYADLEERIAELEATTARKGNRKMSLTVYGQVNAAFVAAFPTDGDNGTAVKNNVDDPSRFGFRGEAKTEIGKVGFLIEVGVGGDATDSNSSGLALRHLAAYLDTSAGRITLGHTSTATDGITEITVANTTAVGKPLSSHMAIGGVGIWDGDRLDLVRYDSPVVAGFVLSAAYAPGVSDTWDAALRWAGEAGGFKAAAGVGYREMQAPTILFWTLPKVQTVSGSASLMHVATGLFAGVDGGLTKVEDVSISIVGGKLGIERKIVPLGATTVWGEWSQIKVEQGSHSETATVYGFNVVQAIDAAAMDLYVSVKNSNQNLDAMVGSMGPAAPYYLDGTTVMGGARIRW